MARVFVGLRAQADLAAILTYLADVAGPKVARDYRERIRALYQLLSEHPDSGARRPAVGGNVRHCVVAPYILLYRHERGAVYVLRIVHGRRRITGAMLRRTS